MGSLAFLRNRVRFAAWRLAGFAALLSRPACLHVLQPLFCLAACLHALPDNFAPLCLAASLRLNCSRVVVVTLANPRCWRFSPTPTATEVRLIRSPSPCSKERRGITVTDSRGFSPHSSNSERHVALPRTQRRSSIFGCVHPVSPSSRGGGQPPNIRRVQFALRFRAVYHFVDKLPHLLSTISIFLAIYYFVGFMLLDFGAEIRG